MLIQSFSPTRNSIRDYNKIRRGRCPKLFKFEPDYLAAKEAQRKEILLKRALIDSMDISEGRRQKLVRDLYRNKDSKRLTKILLANNKFEESED